MGPGAGGARPYVPRAKEETMHFQLENAPSKTPNPSGSGRGNNPPRK